MIKFKCDGKCGREVEKSVPQEWRKAFSFPGDADLPFSTGDVLRNMEYFCPECWARAHTDKRQQDKLTAALPVSLKTYQDRVAVWFVNCFGLGHAGFAKERAHRFLEEALELAQACGASKDDGHKLVDYVFNRARGDKDQEVGGVMVTLAILCAVNGLEMDACGEKELTRIWKDIDKIRAKQAAKRTDSALPGYADDPHLELARSFIVHPPTPADVEAALKRADGVVFTAGALTAKDVDKIKVMFPPSVKDQKPERCNCDASCGENRYHAKGSPGCKFEVPMGNDDLKKRTWPQDFTERCCCNSDILDHFKGSDICKYFWDDNAGWVVRANTEDHSSAEFPTKVEICHCSKLSVLHCPGENGCAFEGMSPVSAREASQRVKAAWGPCDDYKGGVAFNCLHCGHQRNDHVVKDAKAVSFDEMKEAVTRLPARDDWRLVLAKEIRSAVDQYTPNMTARVGLLQIATNLEMTAKNPLNQFVKRRDLDTPSFTIPNEATPGQVIGAALLAVVDHLRLTAFDTKDRDMQTFSTIMAGKVQDFIKKYLQ